jgi:uncharacterized protein YoxC
MAMFRFGKKEKEEPIDIPIPPVDMPPMPGSAPTDQPIGSYHQGYGSSQSDESNNQGYPPQDYGQGYNQYQQMPQQQSLQDYPMNSGISDESVQQIAEAIIDEKWNEFAKDIKKVIEWKEKSEDRIAKIEQALVDINMRMDSLSKSIMTKISSYDQNIVDVGTEIKAMEKVFQKVLPTFTENVNKLDRMTKEYKNSIK